jgi:methylenetetrahydrofolate--tRNA-(uracil-5-)-methyltransferase
MRDGLVTVVGAGLAGSEAAWQIAGRGIRVRLCEMRPARSTPAHRTGDCAELVCSNSLKSLDRATPHGLLKEEMDLLGSLILDRAREHRVPAGGALAVDRERFAAGVTEALASHPRIEIVRGEIVEIPADGVVVLAVGPLVSDRLQAAIARFTGNGSLHFFDAIAPVIEADSIDRGVAFAASRYGKGGGDYLNCPLTASEYAAFVQALLAGEKAPLHEFDTTPFFEGCLPIEEMARRGTETLRFGPMKPVGLADPRTGTRPHAVVQLRQDDLAADHYSMVGFQTQLRWPEQKRIFRMIPGLASAEFVRLGQVHRNCYINAPRVLLPTLQTRARGSLLLAGQISGVEGYTESAATGLLAGINAARVATGRPTIAPPEETMLGALTRYISGADPDNYQPTNAAFGLLPEVAIARSIRRKQDRREARARTALLAMATWAASMGEGAIEERAL